MTDQHGHEHKTHHHILPNHMLVGVGAALLILTVTTVVVAHIDLGRFNFIIAMAIATLKGSLVALIFMNLWYDKKENGLIFATSFLFLAIFIVLTSTDLFFRGDVYVKGPLTAPQTKSKLKNPWISTPELIAHGKELFAVNCVSCHGAEGKGDGVAAAALNPHPRNFTSTADWVNGRKVSMVFKTLKEGVAGSGMASFATLPSDDRWALDHYVLSLDPTPPAKDTPEDFQKAGVDINGGGGEKEEQVIPMELAMSRMAVQEAHADGGEAPAPTLMPESMPANSAARIYAASCLQCHGAHGEGGIHVRNLGVNPAAYVTTQALRQSQGMSSVEAFSHVVMQGIPGELMPGNGQLSTDELRELYAYVHGL